MSQRGHFIVLAIGAGGRWRCSPMRRNSLSVAPGASFTLSSLSNQMTWQVSQTSTETSVARRPPSVNDVISPRQDEHCM